MSRKPVVWSQNLETSLTFLGNGSPAGIVYAPKSGVFYWDKVAHNLYISEAIGKSSWKLTVAGAASVNNRKETFIVTSDGQTTFILSDPPADATKSHMSVNGIELSQYGYHFSISGTVTTFNSSNCGYELETVNQFGNPDYVVVSYSI